MTTDDTNHDGPTIEMGASLFKRFEEERQKTKTDHAPPMDQATFLSALLDTNKAVRDGYYERPVDTETKNTEDTNE